MLSKDYCFMSIKNSVVVGRGEISNMRAISLRKHRKFIVLAVVLLPAIWLLYAKGFGKSHIELKSNGVDEKMVNDRMKQLSAMVEENQGILEKLQADMFEHRKVLLDKLRSEISAENLIQMHKSDPGPPPPRVTTLHSDGVEKLHPNKPQGDVVIPVVITACNRPSVSRCLDKLISVRGSSVEQFPLFVSQDCGHEETAKVLREYGDKITYITHPAEPPPPDIKSNFIGYAKIASHYKFAVNKAFEHFPKADSIIIVEDDIEVSPDFFSYFLAMHDLLLKDNSLWCASAWNDNGKTTQIDVSEKGAETLYRTDFFPGLGWLLKRSLWEEELQSKWPSAFWDDWMRLTEQRKGRACIRPEISRTSTFGRKGVSLGQFFDAHLKYIKLNEFPVNWSQKNLDYLIKENYDRTFKDKVYNLPLLRLSDLNENKEADSREVRLEYTSLATFKNFAKELGLMKDLKKGVPRTAYLGIISTLFKGRRVFLSPPKEWSGYDEKWE